MKVDNNKLQDCFVFPAAHSCERARGESGLIALYYDTRCGALSFLRINLILQVLVKVSLLDVVFIHKTGAGAV